MTTQYQPPQYQQPGVRPTYPQLAQQSSDTVTPGTSTPPASTGTLPAPAGVNATMPYPSTDNFFRSDPMAMGNGGCNPADDGYGALDGCMDDGYSNQWFGGIYGLYMTRTRGPYRAYTAGVDTPDGSNALPTLSEIENESDCAFLVPHWRGGVEVRLGSTFGIGDGCDDCYGDSLRLRLQRPVKRVRLQLRQFLRLPALLPTLLPADVCLGSCLVGPRR